MPDTRHADERVHSPLPVLAPYFSDEAGRRAFVRGIFDRTATDYERMEHVMALGSGGWYRRKALERAGLATGMKVADVAVGTGMVAREAARIVGDPAAVTGIDPSPGMLAAARLPSGVTLLEGTAEKLPLPDACVDFVSMGYALRHVSDLAAAFAEFRRVLKPGGRVLVLEITRPESAIGRAVLKAYMRGAVPALAAILARSRETAHLMRYYWDTIEACVPPESVLCTLAAAGFEGVGRHVELGIFSEYTGRRSG